MEVFRQFWHISNDLEQIIGHVFRITRYKFESFDALNIVKSKQEIGEPCLTLFITVTITVDGLPEQCDFLAALVSEHASFVHDDVRRTSLFGATRHGNDTVGAKFVAADLNPQVSLKRRWTHRGVPHRIKCFVTPFDGLQISCGPLKA